MSHGRPSAKITSCYYEDIMRRGHYKADSYFICLNHQCAYILIQDYGYSELAHELTTSYAGDFIYGPLYTHQYSTWNKLVTLITVLLDIPSINLSFEIEDQGYWDIEHQGHWAM